MSAEFEQLELPLEWPKPKTLLELHQAGELVEPLFEQWVATDDDTDDRAVRCAYCNGYGMDDGFAICVVCGGTGRATGFES
jgi:hypothetical protein